MAKITLTNSSISCFRNCHRLYFYKYVLGYKSARISEAITFGTLWHEAQEAYWSGDEFTRSETDDEFIVSTMLDAYREVWGGDGLGAEYIEKEYSAPLYHPDTEVESNEFCLSGKVDVTAKRVDGTGVLIEHKTTRLDISHGSAYWQRLRLDSQVSMYTLLTGIKCCVYDVTKRPLLRQKKSEDSEAYRERVRLEVVNNPHNYFKRQEVVRLDRDMINFMRSLWGTAEQIALLMETHRWDENDSYCFKYNQPCDFFDVCTGCASLDDDNLYVKKTTLHEELINETK